MAKARDIPSLNMHKVPLAQAIQNVQLRQAAQSTATGKSWVPIIGGRENTPLITPANKE